jgi:choline dehydrogenase-like flavoprotein
MYRDADRIPNGHTLEGFDICIAGAGAAAIAMAKRLAGSSKRILLLCNGRPWEKGEQQQSPVLKSLYAGVLGPFMTKVDPNFLQRSRLNMYGGTTNHFWFYAHPMEVVDLQPRPGYRDACWPIGIEELDRYYPEANTFGHYGPFSYDDIPFWAKALNGEPFPSMSGDRLRNVVWHAQEDPKLFEFQTQFGGELDASSNITVLFGAQVLLVESSPTKDHVTGLACATVEDGKPGIHFRVVAEKYVLALGGIEPVRLLKLSANLGDNAKGLLGRGFMLHPLIWQAAQVTFPAPVAHAQQNFYTSRKLTFDMKPEDGVPGRARRPPAYPGEFDGRFVFNAWGLLAPTLDALRAEQIGNFHSNLFFNESGTEITVSFNWEQVPNENSTIALDGRQTDPVFGQPVVRLDWNLLDQEKRTIIRGLELFRQYFAARGASAFEITTDLSGGPEHWTFLPLGDNPGLQAGDHHMGALRMSAYPEDGIVDRNCKLHTVDNLYVAGSAVYPAAGHANPTLTIVALALRLADHLL